MKILLERFPYRYVECGTLENGFPDYRIQKQTSILSDTLTYFCDNQMQILTAMEDFEYTNGWTLPVFLAI